MTSFSARCLCVATAVFGVLTPALAAQSPLDRADPAVIEKELPQPVPAKPQATPPRIEAQRSGDVDVAGAIPAGAIRVDGAVALPQSAFAPVIGRYAGRTLSPAELSALASDIAGVARAAGFGLATAWIPAQRVTNGVLRVRIDEGRIDAIEAQGPAAAVAQRYLGALVGDRPVPTRALERRLLLAGDVAGVTVGKARLERRGDRNILKVATRRDRVDGRATLDNWGTNSIGPVRAQASVDVNGALADDDKLTIGGVITPFQPREFGLVKAGYAKALGTAGTEIALSGYYAYSNPGGVLDRRDVAGDSLDGEIELSHPVVRSRAFSLWGYAGVGTRESLQSLRGVRIREDRISTAWLSSYALGIFEGGYARGRLAVTKGLDIFDATDRGDRLASRDDAGGTFGKLEYWGEYVRSLGGAVSIQVASEGQIATRPLLSSEEMGLGGRSFLRGYDYREFSGDKGIAGSLELRYDLKDVKPLRKAQLYAYADAGSVGNYRGGDGGGTLASAGVGARAWIGKRTQAGVELGIPLAEGFDDRVPDPRLSFTLATRF